MSPRAKIIFVLLPILVIGLLAWFKFRPEVDEPGPDQGSGSPVEFAPAVRTTRVERSPFESTVVFNGSLVAYHMIDVRSELSGRVRAIHFKDGQEVEAGTPIVEIDTDELEAELRSVREQLELAKINAERQERLFASSGVTARERDEAVSRREVFRAEVDRLEARLRKGVITAPFAGRLGLREVSPGEYLSPSTLITTLQTVDQLRLDFSVPERFLSSIRVGMPVRFSVAGYDRTFSAEVSALDPRIDRNTRSLIVRAEVTEGAEALLPGSYARVELPLTSENAITVPSIAVVRSLNSVSVFLVEDGKAVRREVTVGRRTADAVEIVDGLEVGEVLIVNGVQGVRDGEAVNVKNGDTE